MKALPHPLFLIASIILVIALLYLLAPILTPFLLGGLLAYLVDPLVKRLQHWRIPHLLSVILIFIFLFSTAVLIAILLYPLVYNQIEMLLGMLPELIDWAQNVGMPWLLQFVNLNTIKTSLPATLSKTGWVLTTFINSSMAAIDILISLVLTPIVTFYLLRENSI